MFVGREKELAFLESKYTAENGQLIVLYGRRRVGKTETLKEFCKNKPHVFFACRECTDKLQLRTFSEKMLKEDIPARRYISQFENWEQAFRSVTDLPSGDKKKLLIIDEFPYMCRGNTSIPSVLQNLWDESEKNPLYGRATGVYKMTEMDFYDAVKFFPDYSDTDKVIAYSVLGGIPHYLKQFDPKKSLAENIKNNILTKGCVLYSEVDFLLRQELRETPIYNSLIEAIALGNTKLNEISQKSLVDDTSKTSTYLRNLIQLGIVEREFSVDAGTKERANTNRGTYKLTDNFFRFWYAFVFANYSELEAGDVDGVFHYSVEPQLHQFASMPFEDVCRQYVRKLQQANALPFRYAHMGRWTGKTTVRDTSAPGGTRIAETEIDILAVSKSRNEYLVCECKFKNKPFSYSEYLDTIAKLTAQKEKADFYYALFSESGFDNKIKEADNINKRLWLYELSDIVSGKTDFNG